MVFPPLGYVVEPPIEVEVFERGELLVDEPARGEVADAAAGKVDVDLPSVGASRPAIRARSVDLPDRSGR
jgi:hypothetical protein